MADAVTSLDDPAVAVRADGAANARVDTSPLGLAGWVLVGMAVLALGAAIAGLFVGGIGWDSRFDTDATGIARSLSVGTLQEAYDAIPVTTEFYGLIVYQVADLAHNLLTGSSGMFAPDDSAAYVWQGLVNIAFSGIAALVLAWALGVMTRSRLVGAAGAALLLSTPFWLGGSTVNYKDMPVAAGMTIFAAALAVTLAPTISRRRLLSAFAWAAVGASMAFATRAGSFVLLLAIGAGTAVFAIAIRWRTWRAWLRPIAVSMTGLLVSLVFLVATNPVARLGPVQWIKDSWAYATGGFPWVVTMRTAGVEVANNDITWWYIPAWLLAQLPLLTTVSAIAGAIIVIANVLRSPGWALRERWAWLAPFVIMGVALPVALMLRHIQIYDGIRQLMFLFTPIVVFAVLPISVAERSSRSWRIPQRRLAAVIGLIVVGMSLFASLRWFPYSYAFINPVAGWNKESRQWELDYWGVSAREGIRTLNDLGVTPRAVIPYNDPARPFDPTITQMPADNPSGQPFGYYWFARWNFPTDIPFDCQDLFEIRRDGQMVGKGGVCR